MADSAAEPEKDGGVEGGRGPRLSGWMVVTIVGIVALAAVAVTALVTHSSSTTNAIVATATTKAPVNETTTTAAPVTTQPSPTTTSPVPVPDVLICQGTPSYEPSSVNWCTSACSSYVSAITWTSWTADGASGVGTLNTNTGVPNCSQGTWSAQPNYTISFSNPAMVTYCTGNGGSGSASALLFTVSSFFSGSQLPVFKPPC